MGSSSQAAHPCRCTPLSAEQVKAQLRHTTTETQKHDEKDDLANLRDARKAVDLEG